MKIPSTSGSLWFLTTLHVFAKMLLIGLNERTTQHGNQEPWVLVLSPPAVAELPLLSGPQHHHLENEAFGHNLL